MQQVQKDVRWIGLAVVTTNKLLASYANVTVKTVSGSAARPLNRLGYRVNMQAHSQTDHTKNVEQLT